MNKMNVLGVLFVVLMSVGAVVVMADVNGLGSGDLVGFVNGAFSGVLSAGSLSVSGSTSLSSVSGDDGVFSGDVNATNINADMMKIGEGNPSNELIWLNSSASNNRGIYIIGYASELTYDLIRLNPLNGQRAFFIDQDGDAGSLIIDSESTSNTALNIDAVNTQLSTVKITNAGNATSGSVLAILATNTSHAGSGLSINYDGTGDALVIESDSVINPAFNIDKSKFGMSVTSTVNGGYAGLFKTSASTTASPSGGAVKVLIDNSADTAPALVVQNDGTGQAISVTRGNITISDLAGSGNAYACLSSTGRLYRSGTACS